MYGVHEDVRLSPSGDQLDQHDWRLTTEEAMNCINNVRVWLFELERRERGVLSHFVGCDQTQRTRAVHVPTLEWPLREFAYRLAFEHACLADFAFVLPAQQAARK